jgi:uncharacterized protein
VPASEGRELFVMVLVAVVPVQVVLAILAFLSRDTAGGTTLGLFGATWAAVAVTGISVLAGSPSSALGTYLAADAAVIGLLALAALVGNPAFAVILGIGCVRFALNGGYELSASTDLERAAGWVGLVLCALAAYAGLAFLLEDGRKKPVLPMLRPGAARNVLEHDFSAQLEAIEHEPGVRGGL